jgi:hypothetical protein
MASFAVAYVALAVASVRARRLTLPQRPHLSESGLTIIVAATLCTVCVMYLLISAFAAEPDAELTNAGLTSESSTGMNTFIVALMFLLSIKLRPELLGLSSSCLLQLW